MLFRRWNKVDEEPEAVTECVGHLYPNERLYNESRNLVQLHTKRDIEELALLKKAFALLFPTSPGKLNRKGELGDQF